MVGGDISDTNSVINRTFTTAVQGDDEQYESGLSECIAIFLYIFLVVLMMNLFYLMISYTYKICFPSSVSI